MFLWMEFIGIENSFQLVMDHLLKRKVLLVAGGAFNLSEKKPTPYVRVSYSRASLEDMEKVRLINESYYTHDRTDQL